MEISTWIEFSLLRNIVLKAQQQFLNSLIVRIELGRTNNEFKSSIQTDMNAPPLYVG